MRLLCLCLGLSLSLWFSAAQATSSATDLNKLVGILSEINTFSAQFEQYLIDKTGRSVVQSKGFVQAKRPGLFYWTTEDPAQSIYSDGKQLTVYDPDLEQATVQPIDGYEDTAPALLFSGDLSRIGEVFDVLLRSGDLSLEQFELRPKAQDSIFDTLVLVFDASVLKEMRIRDSLGQDSTISFQSIETNASIQDEVFTPVLPEGTDVIEQVLAN